ncbi:MAG: hypothetical protein ACLGH0_14595 [Thermoanaerobaculia bacterium]
MQFILQNATGGSLTIFQEFITTNFTQSPPPILAAGGSATIAANPPFTAVIMYSGCNNAVTLIVDAAGAVSVVPAENTQHDPIKHTVTFNGA